MSARKDITKKFAKQYVKAGRKEKAEILDALVKATGWLRDHARRAIRVALSRKGAAHQQIKKPRPRKYSYDAVVVLQEVWRLTGQPCGKYLAAVMGDQLERLVRFRELGKVNNRATEAVLAELQMMSPATIDRYLKPHKDAMYPMESLSGTRPSHILRSSIPISSCLDPPPETPGVFELDTVAHCGFSLKGEFLWTLSATDPLIGWTLMRTVKNKAFSNVHPGLDWIRTHAPYPIGTMDVDNGSEFINWAVVAWADSHDIKMTRGRPLKKNDNAHIEQRNGDWIRKHAFRYRYETPHEMELLNELWDLVMARKNHLLPCVKAIGWTQTTSGRKRLIYDKPATAYARLIASGILDESTTTRLEKDHVRMNPARITRRINAIQNELIQLASFRTQAVRHAG